MLKTAAAAGVGVAAWSAPKIETFARVPTAAAGTPTVLLSDTPDVPSVGGNTYCKPPAPDLSCCDQAWGPNGQVTRFTFTNPVPDCSEIVVRTDHEGSASDCGTPPQQNPDIGQTRIYIEPTTPAGPGPCDSCVVKDAILVSSAGRMQLGDPLGAPPATSACADSVNISIACDDDRLTNSTRLAVRIECTV